MGVQVLVAFRSQASSHMYSQPAPFPDLTRTHVKACLYWDILLDRTSMHALLEAKGTRSSPPDRNRSNPNGDSDNYASFFEPRVLLRPPSPGQSPNVTHKPSHQHALEHP